MDPCVPILTTIFFMFGSALLALILLPILLAFIIAGFVMLVTFGSLLFAACVTCVCLVFAGVVSVLAVLGASIQQILRPRNVFSFSNVGNWTYAWQSRSPDLAVARISTDSDSDSRDTDSTDSSDSTSTDDTNSDGDSSGSYVISSSEQLASSPSRIRFGEKAFTQEYYSAWSSRRESRRYSWPQAPIAITLDTNRATQAPLHNYNLRSRTSL